MGIVSCVLFFLVTVSFHVRFCFFSLNWATIELLLLINFRWCPWMFVTCSLSSIHVHSVPWISMNFHWLLMKFHSLPFFWPPTLWFASGNWKTSGSTAAQQRPSTTCLVGRPVGSREYERTYRNITSIWRYWESGWLWDSSIFWGI